METMTRAEKRAATRARLARAAAVRLRRDGIAGISTRAVAKDADVAQSTVMYHFPDREQLLAAAAAQLTLEESAQAQARFEEIAAKGTVDLVTYLDFTWQQLTTPEALIVASLWGSSWSHRPFADTVRELESQLYVVALRALRNSRTAALTENLTRDPEFLAYLDTVLSVIRGLVISIPAWGHENVEARWKLMRDVLVRAAPESLRAVTSA